MTHCAAGASFVLPVFAPVAHPHPLVLSHPLTPAHAHSLPPARLPAWQGVDLTDEELIEHISEMCVMSKGLDEYEGER